MPTPIRRSASRRSLVANDINGDRRSDILWRNANGTLAGWLMNGGSIQSSGILTSGGVTAAPGPTWTVAGISDFNGDGNADVLWRNSDGTLIDWSMNGRTIVSSGVLNIGGVAVKPDATWNVVGTGDFDGDSRADILWRKSDGTLVEWNMDGSNIASSGLVMSSGLAVKLDSTWSVAGVGDFNGDSNSDILWRNDNGAVAEWLMNGNAIMQSVTPNLGGTAVSPDATWSTQAKPTNFG